VISDKEDKRGELREEWRGVERSRIRGIRGEK
jgi:hypothetical protein